ncbi:hypothetical protein OHAE_1207 [Ochrobactrum soli]|uniref:Uncharacterized protein n=1 Tax=Ochrobactrum soli TaxID=2448455 RepID=A0A2P9HND9_9HYPH|nr:hypothetical protein OHAE_1207 [[Ochrobactrum] soli]
MTKPGAMAGLDETKKNPHEAGNDVVIDAGVAISRSDVCLVDLNLLD